MKKLIVLFSLLFLFSLLSWQYGKSAQGQEQAGGVKMIEEPVILKVIDALVQKHGDENKPLLEKGVRQVAGLWQEADGTGAEFEAFCQRHFIGSAQERNTVFTRLSEYFEVLWGHYNKITLDLQRTLQLDVGQIHPIDQLFGGYNPAAHFDDDFYGNKIAFITALNFPFYSLAEKQALGPGWSRKDWAYARMGDIFLLRIPAKFWQKYSQVNTDTDIYISEYNIFIGKVQNEKGGKLFPAGLKLLLHWNLRDELKANYGIADGLEKQQLIYKVMQQIISQEIPQQVINNDQLEWNPYLGKVYRDGKEIQWQSEPNTRYQHLLNNFKALKDMDAFCPREMDTYIKRKFDGEMEVSQPEVEALFVELLSSPQVKKVARLISKRLGRHLQSFDIWYDGFKARSGIPEDKLTDMTRQKYPNAAALEKDLANILMKIGFSADKARSIADKITVDPARGSGHAWGADMRSEKAHLRTRVSERGMNYKGYNIAVHEFGHNVEQVITLHDVDYYMMRGVPNTSFTEALAYIFQDRDLELLGMKGTNPDKEYLDTLDTFWSAYEGMGVSLVDMNVWKWMYAHPAASVEELKEAVINISKDIWNRYYAKVVGSKDQTVLGIYSHMIAYPLYLSAYSYGDLIKFQVKRYIKGKDLASEIQRMFSSGRLNPQLWMKQAVGAEISIQPLLRATDKALKHITK